MRIQINEGTFYDESIEGIMILAESGEMYSVRDEVGKLIWSRLAESEQSLAELVQHIKAEFMIENEEEVKQDVQEFVDQLLQTGVIVECKEIII